MEQVFYYIETILVKTIIPGLEKEGIDLLKNEALYLAQQWLPHAQSKLSFLKSKEAQDKIFHGKLRDEVGVLVETAWVELLQDAIKVLTELPIAH